MIAEIAFAALIQVAANGWLVDDTTSPLDGRRTLMFGKEADQTVPNAAGRPEKPMLVVACGGDRRKVTIIWPQYLGRDQTRVSWKVGEGEIQNTDFGIVDLTTGIVQGRGAQRLLDAMKSEERIAMRVPSYSGVNDVTFDLTGVAEHIAAVESACRR